MMKLLVAEFDYELWYTNYNTFKFILFERMNQIKKEVCRSKILGKCFNKYLSQKSIDTAHAKVHALKYVIKKYKAA